MIIDLRLEAEGGDAVPERAIGGGKDRGIDEFHCLGVRGGDWSTEGLGVGGVLTLSFLRGRRI